MRRAARARCGCRGTRCAMARFGLAGAALGRRARPLAVRRRARAGAAGRGRGPLDAARWTRSPSAAVALVLMTARPRGRLAGGPRRVAAGRRRPRGLPASRWAARSSPATGSSRSTSCDGAGAVLLDVTPRQLLAHRRATGCPARYRRRAAPLPLRPGRLQGRLGAGRPDPVAAPRCAPGRHRAPGRHARRDRGVRGRRRPRAGARPAVRAARPADACSTRRGRPRASTSAWAYCHVPAGSHRRHDRPRSRRRSSGSRPASATCSSPGRRCGPAEMEAHNPNYVGGDINGGAAGPAPAVHPAGGPAGPLLDPGPAPVPLLVLHAARRRRARHVRLLRGPRRPAAAAVTARVSRVDRPPSPAPARSANASRACGTRCRGGAPRSSG